MTNAALRGKPDAGNPHVRFDEGEVAPAATPRRGSLLYKKTLNYVLLEFHIREAAGELDSLLRRIIVLDTNNRCMI